MTPQDADIARLLPLHQIALLRAAIGRALADIERWLVVEVEDFCARGGDPQDFFVRASGTTRFSFTGGVAHVLSVWPSQLSVLVDGEAPDDPYAVRHQLSATGAAPAWLRGCLEREVVDVRVYVYRDDVPSPEPRQSAVSYLLDSGVELFYCTYLHGLMDGDELVTRDAIDPGAVARCVSLVDGSDLALT